MWITPAREFVGQGVERYKVGGPERLGDGIKRWWMKG